jgi:hypothetical protein
MPLDYKLQVVVTVGLPSNGAGCSTAVELRFPSTDFLALF